MKVIVVGASGFIGAEVLRQCLHHPSITSIVALSRRELPVQNPKLKVVIMQDFMVYSPSVLDELEGAESCIWTAGSKSANAEEQRKVSLDFTMAGAAALMQSTMGKKQPFRFVFTSGILSERDQKKSTWFLADARRIRGEVENQLITLAKQNPTSFETFIARPSAVMAKASMLANLAAYVFPCIQVDQLAAAMIQVALDGEKTTFLENADLVRIGKQVQGRS